MSITADLPRRHPAVLVSVLILLIGYGAIGYEEHLKSGGFLVGHGSDLKLFLSLIGLPVWTWIMLSMIGRPDVYFKAPASLVSAESTRRRLATLQALGYCLQAVTLLGFLTFILNWS